MLKSQLPSFSQQRKDDHVKYALEQQNQKKQSQFEMIRFIHHSFSPLSFDTIDLSTKWANHTHSLPFYINGMTGGSESTLEINRRLATVAKATGLAMASGSVSGALSDPAVSASYQIIRKQNPDGFVMANLGAHHSVENAQKAMDLLEANALQIHLNVPQEVVMPEGDRDFTNWSTNIEAIVKTLDVPVIVKEVGFGMSAQTIQHLIDLGVQTIDISGRGGTNFISIENERRDHLNFNAISQWGQTTPESLLESLTFQGQVDILSSGGITDFMDIVKSLAMGAKAVGLSGKFLNMVMTEGVELTIERILNWKEAIQHLMLLLNAPTINALQKTDLILPHELITFAEARAINWKQLANRSHLNL